MGFFSGRVTFVRYRVKGKAPGMFGPEHLDRLAAHAIGKQRTAASDGVEAGWTAGDHILDIGFDLAKNVVNDALHFCLRVDTNKLPSDLLRAYAQVDLQALAKNNPSGVPSAARSARPATRRASASKTRRRTAASSSARRFPCCGMHPRMSCSSAPRR